MLQRVHFREGLNTEKLQRGIPCRCSGKWCRVCISGDQTLTRAAKQLEYWGEIWYECLCIPTEYTYWVFNTAWRLLCKRLFLVLVMKYDIPTEFLILHGGYFVNRYFYNSVKVKEECKATPITTTCRNEQNSGNYVYPILRTGCSTNLWGF